jgi:peroxiredoxin
VPAASNGGGVPVLDRAFVVGRWSDRGDCTDWVEFASDGSFSSWDNVTGIWNLRDDRLTVTGARSISFQVAVVDENTLSATNQAGETGQSTRC